MKLMIVLASILIFNVSTVSAISKADIENLIAAIGGGWKLFNEIFYSDNNGDIVLPTRLLLTYQGKRRTRNRNIHFDSKVQNTASEGPWDDTQRAAQKLVKNKKIDVTEDCDLVYREFVNKEQQIIDLTDEADLIYLMAQPGDLNKGNVRLVEILCGPIPKPPREPNVDMNLFKDNKRAFDYIVAVQNKDTEENEKEAEKSLNKAGMGGFSKDAKAYVALDIDKNTFDSYINGVATAWNWTEQITSQLKMVQGTKNQFSGSFKVWFEPSEWKIKGIYQRFASFKTVEHKFSVYVATADFSYTIPSDQREGGFLARWGVTSNGAINGEYFKKIGHLMEGSALTRFLKDVEEPRLDNYGTYSEGKEL